MSAKFQPGDKVLVEATVDGVIPDGTVGVTVVLDPAIGYTYVWYVPNDIVHFVEAGAE
jgi:hypothetical protein